MKKPSLFDIECRVTHAKKQKSSFIRVDPYELACLCLSVRTLYFALTEITSVKKDMHGVPLDDADALDKVDELAHFGMNSVKVEL